MDTANRPDTNLLWDRNHTAVLMRFVPGLIRPTGRQSVLIQEYCNTSAIKQLLDHSKCSSEHEERGQLTSHQCGGAGEKLNVVLGHITPVPARGTKELSEMLVRRSDLELEPEEKRSARMTAGVGSLSYYGKPRNSVFCLEKQKQMAGAWVIFRHRPRAAGCVLVRGGSGWFAAGAMAPATHQVSVGSSQEKARCKWVEKEAAGHYKCFWGKQS